MIRRALNLANSYYGILTIAGVLALTVFAFFGVGLTTLLVATGFGVTAGVVNGVRGIREHGH